ncbi:MAG: lipopolysaccharide transport periplasmic protein LptA [Thiohalomonadaceae bacterium]
MPRKPWLVLLVLAASPVAALQSDREQPIHIQADRVLVDEARKVSTYEGNVELSQGTLRVTAERVEVLRSGNGVERLVATGAPVTFRQRPDNSEEDIRGQASRVEYTAASALLELIGDAHLWQGRDEFSGPRISYESGQNRVRAEGEGRVRAIIHPQNGKGAQ